MIDEKDIEKLKEIFVTKEKCRGTAKEIEKNVNKEVVKIAVIETKLNIISWLLTAVMGGIITMLVKMFFGG